MSADPVFFGEEEGKIVDMGRPDSVSDRYACLISPLKESETRRIVYDDEREAAGRIVLVKKVWNARTKAFEEHITTLAYFVTTPPNELAPTDKDLVAKVKAKAQKEGVEFHFLTPQTSEENQSSEN